MGSNHQGGLADDEEAAGQGAAALGVDVDQCQRKLSWQRRQDEAESVTQMKSPPQQAAEYQKEAAASRRCEVAAETATRVRQTR